MLPAFLWPRYFIGAQGFKVEEAVMYQDNLSAMLLDNILLFSRSISLRLHWYMTASLISNPCASIKYLDHMNSGSTLSTPIGSTSVELLGFIFYLLDMLLTNIQLRDIVAPLWLWKYGCIAYDAFTHHSIMFSLFTINIDGMFMVDLMHCSTCLSFCQSSSPGLVTLVVRNYTYFCISVLTQGVLNTIFLNEWWNSVARSLSNSFL